MAAALLAEGRTTLTDVPHILDVEIMGELLRRLGCTVDYDPAAATRRRSTCPAELGHQADYDLVRRMRASICVLGPLLARCGQAEVAMPGGDAIGSRPLDFHMAGLTKLGAELDNEHGYIVARAPQRADRRDRLARLPERRRHRERADGRRARRRARPSSTTRRASRRSSTSARCSQQMGAQIDGAGTSTLDDRGRRPARGPRPTTIVPDRIVAGTWAFAAAMTRGDVTVHNARPEHLEIALDKLSDRRRQRRERRRRLPRRAWTRRPRAVDAVTLPYPGLATDLQPLVIALNSIADGAAMITENIFEGRFVFASELARLGADVRTDGHHAVVRGVRAAVRRAGAGQRHPGRRRR